MTFEKVRWAVLGLCGLGCLALAYSLGARLGRSGPPRDGRSALAEAIAPAQLRPATEVRSLDSDRLRRLERAVQVLSERIGENQADPAPAPAPEPPRSQPLTPEEGMRREQVARKTLIELAKQRLASEPRDEAWAPGFEAAILEGTKKVSANVRVQSAACRSTVCEVKLAADTQQSMDQFMLEFTGAYPDCDRVQYTQIQMADGSPGVEMQIVRRETSQRFLKELESNIELALQEVEP